MSQLVLLQAFYTILGILFFVRDIFAKVPMDKAMIGAVIWPYAQWGFIREQLFRMAEPVLRFIQ